MIVNIVETKQRPSDYRCCTKEEMDNIFVESTMADCKGEGLSVHSLVKVYFGME